MIVRTRNRDLLFITQPDHAQMAGRVMEHCEPLMDHPRRDSILRACREHDGGWIEVDRAPSIDPTSHRPLDFMSAPAAVRQGVWPRAIARLAPDPWAAALVAHHAVTVYDRYRSDPDWAAFFATIADQRDRLTAAAGMTREQIAADYPYVRLADLISLTFCAGWPDETPIGDWRVRGHDTHVIVEPDAFGGRAAAFDVACRVVPDRPFADDDDLRAAIGRAPTQTLRGTVSAARL